jgi:N-acetylmuramoyl-L-alanine amidase
MLKFRDYIYVLTLLLIIPAALQAKEIKVKLNNDNNRSQIVIPLSNDPYLAQIDRESGLNGKRICLDPGHGGSGTEESPVGGYTGPNGLREADVNLVVGLILREYLAKAGAEVFMTREEDKRLSKPGSTYADELIGRPKLAADKGCDLFLSIHHNYDADGNQAVNGPVTFYPIYNAPPDPDSSIAEAVQTSMEKYLELEPAPGGRVKPQNYYVLKMSRTPAVMVEIAYISNPDQEKKLALVDYNRIEAWAIFNGLKDYYTAKPEMPVERHPHFSPAGLHVPLMLNPVEGYANPKFLYGEESGQDPSQKSSDLVCPAGTPVRAALAGQVISLDTSDTTSDLYPYKNYIAIESYLPKSLLSDTPVYIYHIYYKLEDIKVVVGEKVKTGEIIGTTGDRKNKDRQFRFEVRLGENDPNKNINPETLYKPAFADSGILLGDIVNAAGEEIRSIVIRGAKKVPGVRSSYGYSMSYGHDCNGNPGWGENFAIGDVAPGEYTLRIQYQRKEQKVTATVEPGKVTKVRMVIPE